MENNNSSGGGCQPSGGAVGEKTCVESTPQNSTPQASEPAMGVIYCITNNLNGKFYVGKTKRSLEVRFKEHFKEKTYIGRVMRKHGIENFTVEVLETCFVDKLNERERYWIAELDCKDPNGYNLTDGGDGLTGCTQGTRAKMSETQKIIGSRPPSFKGKHHSAEARAKLSKAGKGKPSHKKGKPLSAETRAKMSASQKKRQVRERLEREKKAIENGGNK